jgi:hypothetical protein
MLISCYLYDNDWNQLNKYHHVPWYERYLYYKFDLNRYKHQIQQSDFGLIKFNHFLVYTLNREYIGILICRFNSRIALKFLLDYIQHKKVGSWMDIYLFLNKVEDVKAEVEDLKKDTIDYIYIFLDKGSSIEELKKRCDEIT